MVRPVGKHDRRNSMKMKRRKSQVKKKARLKRQAKERKAAPGGATKKPVTRKKPAAPPISGPQMVPQGSNPPILWGRLPGGGFAGMGAVRIPVPYLRRY